MFHPKQSFDIKAMSANASDDPPYDARIKLQFHWQRGAQASHRLSAPMDDNAPASDASSTWVRVAQSSWAGANWGGVFIPRLGQEVLVEFVDGDIDRPVVIGAAYWPECLGWLQAPGLHWD